MLVKDFDHNYFRLYNELINQMNEHHLKDIREKKTI
jgi:hypothetical protein